MITSKVFPIRTYRVWVDQDDSCKVRVDWPAGIYYECGFPTADRALAFAKYVRKHGVDCQETDLHRLIQNF